ncbi:MAG: dTDP-4-dehydrorhamnose reductase [Spirochaetales bacterium]|nr:dTDP-4-dehydrorhamnose reductase [Spirochaetales bacterium]
MIWIIGDKGMLGREVSKALQEADIPSTGTDREVSILEPEALRAYAKGCKPDWIINCSAYTAVDKAEDEKEAAFAINKTGVANIAALASELDIPLIHISTDYVFDGSSSEPLTEEAPAGPTGVYGASKLAGEEKIRKICSKHFIIRTAWLYGQYGPNFVYTMLKLMNKLDTLKVVDDQHGSPTWTKDITGLICTIIESDNMTYGTYHLSGEGECTWFEFAREIFRLGRENGLITSDCTLNPCSSEEFPTPAKRPAYSLLSKEKVKRNFQYSVPDWKESIEQFLDILDPVLRKVNNWLILSDSDIDTAKYLFKGKKYLYQVFTCQQALEKALKAVIEFYQGPPPRIHNLKQLSRLAGVSENYADFFVDLDYYYIRSRYSLDIQKIGKTLNQERCAFFLEKTTEALECIISRIPLITQ